MFHPIFPSSLTVIPPSRRPRLLGPFPANLCGVPCVCYRSVFTQTSLLTPASPPQLRPAIFGLYGGLAVLVTMGWTYMALVLSHCFVLYSVATVKSKLLCLAAGLATLASIKLEPYNSWQVRGLRWRSR